MDGGSTLQINMSDLDDFLRQLEQTKPVEAAVIKDEEQDPPKISQTVKKEVKKRKKKKDVIDDQYVETMLRDVPSRSRVHCSICKKLLTSEEQNWYMRTCDGLEYWWCRKCIK